LEDANAQATDRRFAETFEAQAVDPAWAPMMTAEIRRAVDATLPEGSTLVSLECRTTFCRLVADHKFQDKGGFIAGRGPFRDPDDVLNKMYGGMHFVYLGNAPDDRYRAAIYIAKAGQTLTLR
jgi:hypothetical protein